MPTHRKPHRPTHLGSSAFAITLLLLSTVGCNSNEKELDKLCQTAESFLEEDYSLDRGQNKSFVEEFRERYLAKSPSKKMQDYVFEELATITPGNRYPILETHAREELGVSDWSCPAVQVIIGSGARPTENCPPITVRLEQSNMIRYTTGTPTECITDDTVITVTKQRILVHDFSTTNLTEGRGDPSKMRPIDQVQVIGSLYDALQEEALNQKLIASRNSALTFSGRLLIHADRDTPDETIEAVRWTAQKAGFTDLRRVVAVPDSGRYPMLGCVRLPALKNQASPRPNVGGE